MGCFEFTAQFDAPLERVWQLFTDPERWAQWNTEWDSFRDVRGPFDHHGAGYTQVLRLLGRERLGTWNVVACDPPFRRTVEGVLPIGAPFHTEERFEEAGGRTLVRLKLTWDMPWGWAGRVMEPLMMPLLRRQFSSNMKKARALVE